jgi:hypothetical protein
MNRYFSARPTKAFYVEDDIFVKQRDCTAAPIVPEHIATDTGLIDLNGNCIMRAANPIGFIWSDQ